MRTVQHFDRQPIEQLSIAAIEPVAEAQTSLAQVALDLGDTVQAKWIGSQAIAGLLEWFGVRGGGARGDARARRGAYRGTPARGRARARHRVAQGGRMGDGARVVPSRDPRGLESDGNDARCLRLRRGCRLSPMRRELDGWIHAPSTAHAVTAGVLASAHRSNIGAQQGKSSVRDRLCRADAAPSCGACSRACRRGQSIGALLGYQIERAIAGTSAARFQLSLRQLAPMATDELGNELAAVDGDAARAQARAAVADVVDGLALLRLFPVASLHVPNPPLRPKLAARPQNLFVEQWPAMTDGEWTAIVAGIEGAAATLDVVADALLSESVLQYASGNAARASAAMNAMGSGAGVDPELDVLDVRQPTKRLSHSVFAVIPADGLGWSQTRPRAVAEPRLEAWAARRLGDPASIVVAEVEGTRHTIAEAGLAALDIVFAADAATLERELRAAIPALGDAPLAAARRQCMARRRPAHPGGGCARAHAAYTHREGHIHLAGVARASGCRAATDGRHRRAARARRRARKRRSRRRSMLERMSSASSIPRRSPWRRPTPPPSRRPWLRSRRSGCGWRRRAIRRPLGTSRGRGARGTRHPPRLDQARATLAALRAPRVAPAEPPGPEQIVDECQRVADTLLGDGFRMLPLLVRLEAGAGAGVGDEPDVFAQAVRQPAFAQPPRAKVNAFVRDHATVLDGVALFSEAQLLGGALGRLVRLSVVQLTERDGGTPAPGTDRWLAGPLPDDVPWPDSTAAHLVVELPDDVANIEGPFAGLAIDAWVEAVPFQPDRRALEPEALENPLRNARATTGLAVHANQASARAPQVVLSAVSPDDKRWTTDSVVQTVIEAIELAKARMVTLEHVPGDAAILPAIYVASPWLQARTGILVRGPCASPVGSEARPVPLGGEVMAEPIKLVTSAIDDALVRSIAGKLKIVDPPAMVRLEPDSTTGDPKPGTEARVADPAWMLGRQWQFGELIGDDAGSVVSVRVRSQAVPVTGWAPLDDATVNRIDAVEWRPWHSGAILEELVQDVPRLAFGRGLRQRAEAGQQLVDLLMDAGAVQLAVDAREPVSARRSNRR